MRPFDYRNADGLDDEKIGKNYIYEMSPADETCSSDEFCSPSGLLYCDTEDKRCKAKCVEGGRCRAGIHAMCYCDNGQIPRCQTGTCRCQDAYIDQP